MSSSEPEREPDAKYVSANVVDPDTSNVPDTGVRSDVEPDCIT
jgi:hypothetical protein